MKVALVHYWLVGMRGGERVLERFCELFPGADIFTHVYVPEAMSPVIRAMNVKTTFIQRLPGARKRYQSYLPLMPLALEQLDLRDYDLVLTSEAGPAKGVITRPDAISLCYCHSPMRYLWDQYHIYRSTAGAVTRAAMPLLTHYLRQWDMASASRVDRFAANSSFVRARIAKFYGRDADVIHPPVPVANYTPAKPEDYYLWVGQLVPYKRPDLAIDAFNANGLPLWVVGDGPAIDELKARARPNIRFDDRLDYAALRSAYARTRALVFTAEEDFGIVPVEVNASGRPVIAYGRGGATETVADGRSGLFFKEQTVASLNEAIRAFEAWLPGFRPEDAREQAERFAPDRFDRQILEMVDKGLTQGRL